jgi:tetratricopeptide (TPR) repeat protein
MSKAKADGLFFVARRLEDEGKIMEALQKYDEIHSIDRNYDKAWFYKFKLLLQLGHTEKAAICAQNAVTLKPKWVRRIREVEAQVRIAHNQQYVEIPLVVPKSKAEEERRQAMFSEILFNVIDNLPTTIDDKTVLDTEGDSLAYTKIGQMTKQIEGEGPHRIVDPETKEEWIIERKGIDIVTHAHTGPKKLKDKSLMKESKESRLMLALVRLDKTKRAWDKVSQEELQEILQRKAKDSSEGESTEYSRSRSRSK